MARKNSGRLARRIGALSVAASLLLAGLFAANLVSPRTAPPADTHTAVTDGAPAAVPIGGGTTVPTWTASAQHLGGPYDNKTVRNIVHSTFAGTGAQVRLSNAFGTVPVTFDSVYIGIANGAAGVKAGTNTRATFGGKTSITIPVGGTVLSDPTTLAVPANTNLAVSVHVAGATGEVTGHVFAGNTMYFSDGNTAADESASSYVFAIGSWFWVDAVLVQSRGAANTVVAFGDSITDGVGSSNNANRRYPDYLAQRINAAGLKLSVANQGIGGNQVTANGPTWAGINALARMDANVLAQPGVRTVIFLEGVNDLGNNSVTSTDQLIAAHRQVIARAHARGIKIIGGTIPPYAGFPYHSKQGEKIRLEFNHWVRSSGEYDGVADFDLALRDPANPGVMAAKYDSGDHLHPNDAGYQAMARAINLNQL